MAWDSSKSVGDLVSSSDWNSMVSDQKSHASRHESDGSDNIKKIGNSTTYIEVDTNNDEIKFIINSEVVQKWT